MSKSKNGELPLFDEVEESEGLPNGWSLATVKEVSQSIQYGHTASAEDKQDGPRFLRITDIQGGKVDWNTVPSCEIEPDEIEKYRLANGDLVFARTGATTGKSFLIQNSPDAVFASYLIRLRMNDGFEPRYVAYFFQSLDYWRQIEKGKRGIGQPNVNAKTLGGVRLPIAPLPEQKRIVSKIEELFSDLDAGVSALKRARANLRRYRASVLKSAVEGRLTAAWRAANPGVEPATELLARILRERRQRWEQQQLATYESKGKKPPKNWQSKYKEPAAPDTANLPQLPNGWCWATVDQLTEFVTSGSRGWAKYYSDEGSTFIRAQDIKTDALKLDTIAHVNPPDSAEGRRTQTKHLDLLVTITGANVTKTAIEEFGLEDAYVSQHVALVRPVDTSLTQFMHLFIVCPSHGRRKLEKDAYGAGKPGLNLDNIRTLNVPVPPILESVEINNRAELLLDAANHLEESAHVNEQKSNRLRQSILKSAFSGELTGNPAVIKSSREFAAT